MVLVTNPDGSTVNVPDQYVDQYIAANRARVGSYSQPTTPPPPQQTPEQQPPPEPKKMTASERIAEKKRKQEEEGIYYNINTGKDKGKKTFDQLSAKEKRGVLKSVSPVELAKQGILAPSENIAYRTKTYGRHEAKVYSPTLEKNFKSYLLTGDTAGINAYLEEIYAKEGPRAAFKERERLYSMGVEHISLTGAYGGGGKGTRPQRLEKEAEQRKSARILQSGQAKLNEAMFGPQVKGEVGATFDQRFPTTWTVTVDGKDYTFKTKKEAENFAQQNPIYDKGQETTVTQEYQGPQKPQYYLGFIDGKPAFADKIKSPEESKWQKPYSVFGKQIEDTSKLLDKSSQVQLPESVRGFAPLEFLKAVHSDVPVELAKQAVSDIGHLDNLLEQGKRYIKTGKDWKLGETEITIPYLGQKVKIPIPQKEGASLESQHKTISLKPTLTDIVVEDVLSSQSPEKIKSDIKQYTQKYGSGTVAGAALPFAFLPWKSLSPIKLARLGVEVSPEAGIKGARYVLKIGKEGTEQFKSYSTLEKAQVAMRAIAKKGDEVTLTAVKPYRQLAVGYGKAKIPIITRVNEQWSKGAGKTQIQELYKHAQPTGRGVETGLESAPLRKAITSPQGVEGLVKAEAITPPQAEVLAKAPKAVKAIDELEKVIKRPKMTLEDNLSVGLKTIEEEKVFAKEFIEKTPTPFKGGVVAKTYLENIIKKQGKRLSEEIKIKDWDTDLSKKGAEGAALVSKGTKELNKVMKGERAAQVIDKTKMVTGEKAESLFIQPKKSLLTLLGVKKEVFHGTTPKSLESILRSGISPEKAGKFWDVSKHGGGGATFTAEKAGYAQHYAKGAMAKINLKVGTKVLDFADIPEATIKDIYRLRKTPMAGETKPMKPFARYQQRLIEFAKSKGYDAIRKPVSLKEKRGTIDIERTMKKSPWETAIINPEAVADISKMKPAGFAVRNPEKVYEGLTEVDEITGVTARQKDAGKIFGVPELRRVEKIMIQRGGVQTKAKLISMESQTKRMINAITMMQSKSSGKASGLVKLDYVKGKLATTPKGSRLGPPEFNIKHGARLPIFLRAMAQEAREYSSVKQKIIKPRGLAGEAKTLEDYADTIERAFPEYDFITEARIMETEGLLKGGKVTEKGRTSFESSVASGEKPYSIFSEFSSRAIQSKKSIPSLTNMVKSKPSVISQSPKSVSSLTSSVKSTSMISTRSSSRSISSTRSILSTRSQKSTFSTRSPRSTFSPKSPKSTFSTHSPSPILSTRSPPSLGSSKSPPSFSSPPSPRLSSPSRPPSFTSPTPKPSPPSFPSPSPNFPTPLFPPTKPTPPLPFFELKERRRRSKKGKGNPRHDFLGGTYEESVLGFRNKELDITYKQKSINRLLGEEKKKFRRPKYKGTRKTSISKGTPRKLKDNYTLNNKKKIRLF